MKELFVGALAASFTGVMYAFWSEAVAITFVSFIVFVWKLEWNNKNKSL